VRQMRMISEGSEGCHNNLTVHGGSHLRTCSAGDNQWKASLFSDFPLFFKAVEWCNSNLGTCDPERVGNPFEDVEMMPNLVFVRAGCVPQFNECKLELLRQAVMRWRASNPGKQNCTRPCVRGPVNPTGEKDASSSHKEEAFGGRARHQHLKESRCDLRSTLG